MSHSFENIKSLNFGEKMFWVLNCMSVGVMFSPFLGVNQGSPPLLSLPAALFLQQCHFLRQAGHSEKAISLFQAMVDFTFFKPDSVKDLPTKGQVRVLLESPPPRLHLYLSPPLPLSWGCVDNGRWWSYF